MGEGAEGHVVGGLAGLGGDVGVDQERYDQEDIRGGPLMDEALVGTDTGDEAKDLSVGSTPLASGHEGKRRRPRDRQDGQRSRPRR